MWIMCGDPARREIVGEQGGGGGAVDVVIPEDRDDGARGDGVGETRHRPVHVSEHVLGSGMRSRTDGSR